MSEPYSGHDRRRYKRVRVKFTVTYKVQEPIEVRIKVGNIEASGLMFDLSPGGMAISTGYNIPRLTVLLITFILIDESKNRDNRLRPMKMTGEVRYSELAADGESRLGIRFTHISEEDKQVIAEFVRTKSYA